MTGEPVARTVAIDDPGPLSSLMPAADALLFVQHGDGLLAWGTHARVPVEGAPTRFPNATAALRKVFDAIRVADEVNRPGTGPVGFGAFTFDPRVRGSVLVVPRVVVGRSAGRAWLTVIEDATAPGATVEEFAAGLAPAEPGAVPVAGDRVRYAGSTIPEMAWLAAVDQAVDELRAGVAEKVVLARDRRVWSRAPFDPRRLVARLVSTYPECQTFSVDGLVGASPEVLLERSRERVRSLVLAGTAPRGDHETADRAHAERLLSSDKDLREHGYAVESVRRSLDRRLAEVRVARQPHVLRLANVMHLATEVRADLPVEKQRDGLDALSLAGLLHPSAAVCGTPTAAAQAMIKRLEGMGRSRYSGPVGWVDARGDGQWAIALRCAEVNGTRARLFAGAGIVDGSLPEAELEETRLKLRAMQSAFEA